MPPSYTTPSSLETVYPKANITCSRCGSLALGDQQSSFPSVETEIGSFRWLPRIPSIPWDSVVSLSRHEEAEDDQGIVNLSSDASCIDLRTTLNNKLTDAGPPPRL